MADPDPAVPPTGASRGERAKRELRLAVLLSLLGSAVVLYAGSRAWVSFSVEQGLTIARSTTEVSGSLIVPGAKALGLVGLAGVVAVAATRRVGRVLVGLLMLAAGLGVVVVVARVLTDLQARGLAAFSAARGVTVPHGVTHPSWAYGCLLGGVLLALAGLLVTVRGRNWAALSSAYEPPKAHITDPSTDRSAAPGGDKAAWDALDRGDDPTQ